MERALASVTTPTSGTASPRNSSGPVRPPVMASMVAGLALSTRTGADGTRPPAAALAPTVIPAHARAAQTARDDLQHCLT
jgi:hypothetical protein